MKGLYDKRGEDVPILVTGSARLDYYRKGGDSLQGRYHFYRLMPLTLAELGASHLSTVEDLLTFGGFPEPFALHSEKESRRWRRDYRTRLIREDLADLENVQDSEGRDIDLRYFRDVDRREVDFVITEEGRPTFFVECKRGDKSISRSLRYMKKRFPKAQAIQVYLGDGPDRIDRDGIRICPAHRFLSGLV